MKRFLVHLLMLLMLTPGLACGPFMAAGKAHAAATKMSDMPDCHGMATGNSTEKKSLDHGAMMFKDCAKVDLLNGDHVVLKKPDTGKTFFMTWAGAVSAYIFTPAAFHTKRGPPFDSSPPHLNNHNLYLTTQRLRI